MSPYFMLLSWAFLVLALILLLINYCQPNPWKDAVLRALGDDVYLDAQDAVDRLVRAVDEKRAATMPYAKPWMQPNYMNPPLRSQPRVLTEGWFTQHEIAQARIIVRTSRDEAHALARIKAELISPALLERHQLTNSAKLDTIVPLLAKRLYKAAQS